MKIKRINEIENYIKQKQEVSLYELKDKFNVSLNTIRRDVNELEKENVIHKVYGGVVYNSSDKTLAYEERNISYLKEKQTIGHYCSSMIEENDIVYIDSGTTTHYVLDQVDSNIHFTLITNSLEVMNKAVMFPNVTLLIVGNTYKRSTKSFTGLADNEIIDKFNVNKAFMSATAFSVENGASNSDLLENKMKSTICKRSNHIYLLIDSSKFGKTSLFTYCNAPDIHTIVTDENIDPNQLENVRNKGGNLIVVKNHN